MKENKNLFDMILNLSKYHREHEKFYAQRPLEQAVTFQKSSRVLKTLADRWKNISIQKNKALNPYMGCEDLNETSIIQENGVLFMEGEGEPPEISRLKRDISSFADDFKETGEWLSMAMKSSWDAAKPLLDIPNLASVLGERHRIIINDWQASYLSFLISQLSRRAVEILNKIDFSPDAVRENIDDLQTYVDYLYSASELLDRAADIASESAILVHDNEKRWRMFHNKVDELSKK